MSNCLPSKLLLSLIGPTKDYQRRKRTAQNKRRNKRIDENYKKIIRKSTRSPGKRIGRKWVYRMRGRSGRSSHPVLRVGGVVFSSDEKGFGVDLGL